MSAWINRNDEEPKAGSYIIVWATPGSVDWADSNGVPVCCQSFAPGDWEDVIDGCPIKFLFWQPAPSAPTKGEAK